MKEHAVEFPQYQKIWKGQPVSLADVSIESPQVIPAIAGLIDKGDLIGKSFFDFDNEGNVVKDVLIYHRNFVDKPQESTPLTHAETEKRVDKWMRIAKAPQSQSYALNGVQEEVTELFDAQTPEDIAHEAGDLIIRLHQLIIISGFQVEPIIESTLHKLYTKYPPHLIGASKLPFTEAMAHQKKLWEK